MKLYETSFGENKFQLFYCFHVAALLFISAQPILGHFLPIFDGFSSKLPGIANFSLKIVIFFIILDTSLPFCFKILSGDNFQFSVNFGRFSEYTLNMTSYHVTEAINGYF